MRISKKLRAIVTLAVCAAMSLPHSVMANGVAVQVVDGIKVSQHVKNLQLGENGTLAGVIVDESGKPVASSPVVIGHQGKAWAEFDTGADGRYQVTGLKTGIYQVVSYAGVETYRVFEKDAPVDAVEGVVQVVSQEGIQRGQACGNGCNQCGDPCCKSNCNKPRYSRLRAFLSSPIVWGVIIAAAIAIPLALDDDDAS